MSSGLRANIHSYFWRDKYEALSPIRSLLQTKHVEKNGFAIRWIEPNHWVMSCGASKFTRTNLVNRTVAGCRQLHLTISHLSYSSDDICASDWPSHFLLSHLSAAYLIHITCGGYDAMKYIKRWKTMGQTVALCANRNIYFLSLNETEIILRTAFVAFGEQCTNVWKRDRDHWQLALSHS